MTLRGKVAIVGIGEVPTRRLLEGRTLYGLCAEAAREAIADAGLRKQDINGLVTDGGAAPAMMAEYIDIKPTFATGVSMQGASGASATTVAASAINAGHVRHRALVVMGNSRAAAAVPGGASVRSEWEEPYGMAPGRRDGLRADLQPPHVRVRHDAGADGQGGLRPAIQRAGERQCRLPRTARERPGHPQLAVHQLPASSAGVRDAMRRRRRADHDDAGAGAVAAQSSGVPARRGHGAVQRQHMADGQDHRDPCGDQREARLPDGWVRSGGYGVCRVLRLIHHPRGREPPKMPDSFQRARLARSTSPPIRRIRARSR